MPCCTLLSNAEWWQIFVHHLFEVRGMNELLMQILASSLQCDCSSGRFTLTQTDSLESGGFKESDGWVHLSDGCFPRWRISFTGCYELWSSTAGRKNSQNIRQRAANAASSSQTSNTTIHIAAAPTNSYRRLYSHKYSLLHFGTAVVSPGLVGRRLSQHALQQPRH